MSCLVVRCHVVGVEVPVELGSLCFLESFAETDLHLLHHVEAHEEIGVVFQCNIFLLSHFAIEHALVGQLFVAELLAVLRVDILEAGPQFQEPLFQFTVMVGREIAEEALQQFRLFLREIGQVVEFVDVAQVAEHVVSHRHILIDVVEIADEQLSPAVEMVECLVDSRDGDERAVEFADQSDGVAHGETGMLAEEVADGDVRRTPDGVSRKACQCLVEEERGALVGEHYGNAAQVVTVFPDDVFCDYFEECFHFTSSILLV